VIPVTMGIGVPKARDGSIRRSEEDL
jgi:hypothetical protein